MEMGFFGFCFAVMLFNELASLPRFDLSNGGLVTLPGMAVYHDLKFKDPFPFGNRANSFG